jgi:cytochrome c-type biogenesis protein
MSDLLASSKNPFLNKRLIVFSHALFFVLGFSLIFIVGWGGAATLLGQVFGSYKSVIGKIGGVVVILFGFYTLGLLKISWLSYDTRPQLSNKPRSGLLASAIIGVFFAAGWTPCIGTTLGTILTLGFSQETAGQAMVLSSGYAIGLGVPFLAIGFCMERATHYVRRFQPHLRWIQIASGVFLILIGVMMLSNQITLLAIWAQRNGFFLDLPLGSAMVPTYFIALVAGLLSFLSPCVLPLVPAYVGYLSGHALSDKRASERV